MRIYLTLLALLFTLTLNAQGPNLYPRPSQLAKVFQRIGTTDLELIYHAPLANGRKIFGDIVPFNDSMNGKPHPWRAGANENTVFKTSHDVTINGRSLKAGTYGLHIFVSKQQWELAFSSNSTAWGSFFYKAEEDVLRVPVTPVKAPNQDWLSYRFTQPRANAVALELHWEETSIQVEIATQVEANILADVMALDDPNWAQLLVAAQHTIALNPKDTDEAMRWVEASISKEAHLNNRLFKSELLVKKGDSKAALQLKKQAIASAPATELFSYAMSLNNKGQDKEALEILALNLKKHPEHWYSQLGYANYYRTHDDKRAIAYHEKAVELAPENAKGFATYQLGYAKSKLGL